MERIEIDAVTAIIPVVDVGVWGLDVPVPPASAQSSILSLPVARMDVVQVPATEQEHP